MKAHTLTYPLLGWLVGLVIAIVGVLNLVLVHPVPGIAYLLISLVYLPPVNVYLKRYLGLSIPVVLKVVLAIVLFMFTLGVSDLGDMIDKL
ncbi:MULTISPECIES: hypothetical protein [Pontibacter]|uniref:Uncharacterized protein n=1 Tax=Pontibacter lucknowensis TaxID=1077936 RepID=A0A1N7B486_9BACT|nr:MULTISPECIES: hypothetical protein [Pontibacter]EJF08225.1 hypothetical protein O71_22139 [Pontibacter sp. BAB1700]SIR46112.1 hypothetical protein SAMN05421545_3777 [Pontibacter lucknowensis]